MKKNIKWKKLKNIIKLEFIFILFLFYLIFQNGLKNILGNSVQNKKYWVGGKYEIFKKNI